MEERLYALAIAGGRGERLKPLTDELPKSMVPCRGRPLISYQVEWLVGQGVTDVVFLCGYLGEKIEEYFGDGASYGCRIQYSFEDQPLGRGGAVRRGLSLVPDTQEFVVVTNGDILTNQPIGDLAALHRRTQAMATMMLVPYQSQFGVVQAGEDSRVQEFIEKGQLPFWINAGVYLFDRQIETRLPEVGDHETTTFQELAAERRLAALKSNATWLSVDSAKDLRDIEDKISAGALGRG